MKPLAILLVLLPCAVCAGDGLKLQATVPLPGVKGRFDHFAIDTNTHRLFVAALGNNTVEVIDGANAKHMHTITGQHRPTGLAFPSAAHRLFVANGDDGSVKVYDGATYRLVKNIGGLEDADNIRYDAGADLLYIGYGDGALAIVQPAKLEIVGRIRLKAHPESFQLEQKGSRIFVNVPDAKQIAVVDREKRTLIATWPMEKFQANFPMALDEENHRLFVGCRKPARLVVVDTLTGEIVADFIICSDTDDLFWGAAGKRLYISCGEGVLDVCSDTGRAARIATRGGARTSFFAPQLKRLFLAVPERNGTPAEMRIFGTEE